MNEDPKALQHKGAPPSENESTYLDESLMEDDEENQDLTGAFTKRNSNSTNSASDVSMVNVENGANK